MREMNLKEQFKLLVSIILGTGITVFSFFAFILLMVSTNGFHSTGNTGDIADDILYINDHVFGFVE
jgi:hypothetical protein